MTRTFIALEMNTALHSHLEEVIRQVAAMLPGVRWVDPAGIHLTLAFLGELSDGEVAGAIHAAEAAAKRSSAFSYRLSKLGTFGPPHQPRVIWMGIEEPSGALQHLHRTLNQELKRRRFTVDTRPFSPHLTLARIKAPLQPGELQQLQQLEMGTQKELLSTEVYQVQGIDVMKSELLPKGARYTVLQTCQLAET